MKNLHIQHNRRDPTHTARYTQSLLIDACQLCECLTEHLDHSHSLSPGLPPELERNVFKLAALDRPLSVPILICVAWRVKQWVEPLLYRTLVIDGSPMYGIPYCDMDTFRRITETKSPDFLADAVRNVMVGSSHDDHLQAILSACPGIQNLFVGGTAHAARAALDMLPLRHLYYGERSVFELSVDDPCTRRIFARLTHLQLHKLPLPFDGARFASTLAQIPNLSHLAIKLSIRRSDLCRKILDACTLLRVLVLVTGWTWYTTGNLTVLADEVRLVKIPIWMYRVDWKMGVLTGDDFWARAESIVAKRISGEVEDSYVTLLQETIYPNDERWHAAIHLFSKQNAIIPATVIGHWQAQNERRAVTGQPPNRARGLIVRSTTAYTNETLDLFLFFIGYWITRRRVAAICAALAAVVILEFLRNDIIADWRDTYAVDANTAQTIVCYFLCAADILGACMLSAALLSEFAALLRFLILAAWTGSLSAAFAEFSLGKRGDVAADVFWVRRWLFESGATLVRRTLWAAWLVLFVAWASDIFHRTAPRRPIASDNFGPWIVGGHLFVLNDALLYVWKKAIVCVLVRGRTRSALEWSWDEECMLCECDLKEGCVDELLVYTVESV
ncbi:hypothetical protein GGX14DRAFT_647725 [Mycena pura]|uniref:Uncharacterized protein n=1 Tax=Mycena pura TaxID=153505 RepID=A0AAD6VA99_9AGAR|nr:hypothetical protein GGX14DRAFT_647725 [Mycena pura]